MESCGVLQQLIPGLEGQIVSQVVNGASHGLDAAKNIPRLYRRTNKEVIIVIIIWQAPRAGSMRRILCSDWLPERAR